MALLSPRRFKKLGITFHIYERNDGQNYRAQDYRIRVARDAVTNLQWLFDEKTWRSFELTCGETRLVPVAEIDAASAHVCEAPNADASLPQDAAKPYTVDRTTFREVMLRDLGAHVSWGKEVVRYEETSSEVEVYFSYGSSDKGALLIGADGACSNVRQQYIPNHKTEPTRGFCVYGKTPLRESFTKSLEPAVLRDMGAIKDRSQSIYSVTVMEPVVFTQREEMLMNGFECPEDYLYWVLSDQKAALGLENDVSKTREESAAIVEAIAEGWHPALRGILTEQLPDNTALLSIRSVPEDLEGWAGDQDQESR